MKSTPETVDESIERKVIVPLWQHEEGVKAINQIAIIKRMVNRGYMTIGNLMDVLDIPEWERHEGRIYDEHDTEE